MKDDDFQVTIIKDSISERNKRLPTIHWRYPRMVHSEIMTHRVFSRNGRSSRAVPVITLLQEDPYLPHFMKNKPGMQSTEELSPEALEEANKVWMEMVDFCKSGVKKLQELEVHKQWSNRPLEWFGYIDVLVSSTSWNNFFALRDEDGAQPELQILARKTKEALKNSTPKLLREGEWHLPYITDEELFEYGLEICQKISVARCARLSYKPFDGNANIDAELKRYHNLIVSRPVHASPAEHQATPDPRIANKKLWGNFNGFIQYRKTIPDEFILD